MNRGNAGHVEPSANSRPGEHIRGTHCVHAQAQRTGASAKNSMLRPISWKAVWCPLVPIVIALVVGLYALQLWYVAHGRLYPLQQRVFREHQIVAELRVGEFDAWELIPLYGFWERLTAWYQVDFHHGRQTQRRMLDWADQIDLEELRVEELPDAYIVTGSDFGQSDSQPVRFSKDR
jgi:hypothetical protein